MFTGNVAFMLTPSVAQHGVPDRGGTNRWAVRRRRGEAEAWRQSAAQTSVDGPAGSARVGPAWLRHGGGG
jgi:hypothetical protein